VRQLTLQLVVAAGLFGQSSSSSQEPWVSGEIVYRVTVVPAGSVGARIALRVGDILAEPGPLPARLREAQAEGVEIPLFRLEESRYRRKTIRVAFKPGEEKRLGITGDLGFLVEAVEPGSLAARAELRTGDFIPKINDAFVHSLEDLKLVDQAYVKRTQVFIHVTRWLTETKAFQDSESRLDFQE
jgi:hypothetical protein